MHSLKAIASDSTRADVSAGAAHPGITRSDKGYQPLVTMGATDAQRRALSLAVLSLSIAWTRRWTQSRVNAEGRNYMRMVSQASFKLPAALEEADPRVTLVDVDRDLHTLYALVNDHPNPPPEFLIPELYDTRGTVFGVSYVVAGFNGSGGERRWWGDEVVAACLLVGIVIGALAVRYL